MPFKSLISYQSLLNRCPLNGENKYQSNLDTPKSSLLKKHKNLPEKRYHSLNEKEEQKLG